mgnify:CR=1 FL=1
MNQDKPLLAIKNLTVEYRTDDEVVKAVNDLSLTLGYGESLGLVGETGAGKTTTALSILRLVPDPPGIITDGTIQFEGEDLLNMPKNRMREMRGNAISMIFQDPMTSLNPVYSVGAQIAEAIALHACCDKKEAREKAEAMLEKVGIPRERYDEYPHQFSGGMKQRVVIAMSISCSPQLILADEPTTALDVTIQAQVLELMQALKDSLNTSLLLITHDLGVVAQVCDNVAIMYAGRIVERGSREEIFLNPAHPYTIGLFGSIPTLDDDQETLKPIEGQMPDPTNLPTGCAFHPRCPYAGEACRVTKPKEVSISNTHQVECLVYEGEVESPTLLEVFKRGR